MKFTILICLGLFIFACTEKKTTADSFTDSLRIADSLFEVKENLLIKDDRKILRTVFVKDSTELFDLPDYNSHIVEKCGYATELEVIEEKGDWLGVWSNKGHRYPGYNHENQKDSIDNVVRLYIPKKTVCNYEDFKLEEHVLDLQSVSTGEYTKGYKFKMVHSKEFLKFELIDKAAYNSKKIDSVSFVRLDSIIEKKKGVLELKCKKKSKKYIDRKTEIDDEVQSYSYVGKVDSLNKYLIQGSYYESNDYKYVDITSGIETNTFPAFPYISNDKKKIICFNFDSDTRTIDVNLYSIELNKIKLIKKLTFSYWSDVSHIERMFWAKDGYFYLPVVHSSKLWDKKGNWNYNYQYMRIKVL